ncbi:MAG: GAF domain-containing protein [Chloroflexi bacterium]|nr:MAG: GAF domain-containing protein [Chloroflexota bacterium]
MTIAQLNSFLPLIASAFYAILLVTPFTRRTQVPKQGWFLSFLATSIIWELLLSFESGIRYPINLSLMALLTGTLLLGGLTIARTNQQNTAVPAKWPTLNQWLIRGGLVVLGSYILNIGFPAYALILSENLPTIRTGTLYSYLAWLGLNAYLLRQTWFNYRKTTFPWHANRLLYWTVVLSIIFTGEALIFSQLAELAFIGQILRLFGVSGLAYAILSHRIFDVRTKTQRVLAFLIITLISALPLTLIILGLQVFTVGLPRSVILSLTAVTILLGLVLYQPFRQIVQRVVYRYLLGETFNPTQVVRNYSQAISRVVDVQELTALIIEIISNLLGTNRGALILVTKQEEGHYEMEPIPARGRILQGAITFSADSPFIKTLQQNHQPLLQYEIDFNPDFANLDKQEQQWLQELAMEVYVPISGGGELEGLIALGPKYTAVPYQPGELELVQVLADQTVIALQNARLFSELGRQNEQIRQLNIDLTHQNERLAIMDRVKSDFITIASHELRTPLTQVRGYADILESMNEENLLSQEQTRQIAHHITRAANRLEELISAMLDASQLDAEGMKLSFVDTTVEAIIHMAEERFTKAIKERQLNLEKIGLTELPPIKADLKRLVQAFSNLLGNAIKYTPDHGKITIEGKPILNKDNQIEFVEVIIADTGIGIDPKYHDLIFEKFFRVGDPKLHSTGTTKFKGAGPGLGLPIAKGVIEAHGGRIWVESEGEDEERLPGSQFHIILPLLPPGAKEQEAEQEKAKSNRPAYLIG